MPIFLRVEEVDADGATGGGLQKVGTGTVFLTNSNTYSGGFRGGINVAAADLNSDAPANGVLVSRLSLLNFPSGGGAGVVDSRDADAASKVRMLFDARKSLGLSDKIVVTIPKNNIRLAFRALNFLRQTQAGGRRIPVMRLIVNSRGSSKPTTVQLEDVLIAGYQNGGAPSASESLTISFRKYEYVNV